MSERVLAVMDGIRWDPNAPEAVLVQDDSGNASLALRPHFDDPDQRVVVLVWSGCQAATMSPPNDEAVSKHRLYEHGLTGLMWLGEVHRSEWLRSVSAMVASPARRHFVALTKEATIEALANDVHVMRLDGSTRSAAVNALGTHS